VGAAQTGEMSWLSPTADDRLEASSSVVDKPAEDCRETGAEKRWDTEEEQWSDFSVEYETWTSRASEILERLDQLRRGLDERVAAMRGRSVQEPCVENGDDLAATRRQLERLRNVFRGTERFVVEGLGRSLEALRHSLSSFSEMTRDKLIDGRNPPAQPGIDSSASVPTKCHVSPPGSKSFESSRAAKDHE